MPSLLNRNGVYYATFSDSRRSPRQKRHSLKTTSRRTAERMAARLGEAYALGEWDAWVERPEAVLAPRRVEDPKRVAEMVRLYVAHVERTLAPSTQRSRRAMVRRFEAHVGGATYVERVTTDHVATFVGAGGPKPLTERQRLTGLRAFLSFCVDEGALAASPAKGLRPPKAPARLPRAVTAEELDRIVAALPEGKAWCGPAFQFAALTGLRASEIARLRWSDVDRTRRLLTIEVQKNGRAGTQPFPEAGLAVLDALPRRSEYVFTSPEQVKATRHVPTFRTLLTMAFKAARDTAGIDRPITLHGLRHGFCTRLAESGASAFVIAAAARHGSVTTSQRYVSIANEGLKARLDEVFG